MISIVSEQRVRSVISKIGRVKRMDMNRIGGLLVKDALGMLLSNLSTSTPSISFFSSHFMLCYVMLVGG
jgi:hypothetical protein